MSWSNNRKFEYIPGNVQHNKASKYSKSIFTSELDRYNPDLQEDYQKILDKWMFLFA